MVLDGRIFSLFPAFDRLEVDATPDLVLAFEFEGDAFEMEDQRNWTDGSFKTYSTPLSLPFPFQAKEGQRFHQRVRVEVRQSKGSTPTRQGRRRTSATTELCFTGATSTWVPPIGLCLDSDAHVPDEREMCLLRGLAPSYLRADVLVPGSHMPERLGYVAHVASALDLPVELALTFTGGSRASREAMARLRPDFQRLPCLRFLVFHAEEPVTSRELLVLARGLVPESLRGVPVVGGTNLTFADLNRCRPDPRTLDGVAFSVTPQVHDSDDAAIVQSLEGQGDAVRTARSFAGLLPLHVGAITLKPRVSPSAVPPGKAVHVPEGDERQSSLFTAAWTAMSAKHLAEAGAASLTFFELTGGRGTFERTLAGQVAGGEQVIFPVYHVLRELNTWRGFEIVGCSSSRPLTVEAFAARQGDLLHVLVANLTPCAQGATLTGVTSSDAEVGMLDETAGPALSQLDGLRALRRRCPVKEGTLKLKLSPYAMAFAHLTVA